MQTKKVNVLNAAELENKVYVSVPLLEGAIYTFDANTEVEDRGRWVNLTCSDGQNISLSQVLRQGNGLFPKAQGLESRLAAFQQAIKDNKDGFRVRVTGIRTKEAMFTDPVTKVSSKTMKQYAYFEEAGNQQ